MDKEIIKDYLSRRGYKFKSIYKVNIKTFDDISYKFSNDNSEIDIYWIDKFGKVNLKYLIESNFFINDCIIIYRDKITSECKNNIKFYLKQNKKLRIEIFFIEELQFNIFDHVLSSQHISKLSIQEKLDLLKIYNIKHLTRQLLSDPISKALACEPNDIVKYIDNNEITYRLCFDC